MTEGIVGKHAFHVEENMTASIVGSGTLQVLATPVLAAQIERTAWESIANQLDAGTCTVGTKLEISHMAPTPVGMWVRCETTLKEVQGRLLIFAVEAYDEKEQICTGVHERVIVYSERFQTKADAKK